MSTISEQLLNPKLLSMFTLLIVDAENGHFLSSFPYFLIKKENDVYISLLKASSSAE